MRIDSFMCFLFIFMCMYSVNDFYIYFMHINVGGRLVLLFNKLTDSPPQKKKFPFPLRDRIPCNTWYIRPTRVVVPRGIWIGSAVYVCVPNATLYNALSVGKTQLPLHVGISLPCRRRTEPQPWATCTKMVNIVVREICSRTHKHTHRRAHHYTSPPFPRAK